MRLVLASLQDRDVDAWPAERVRDLVGSRRARIGYVSSSVNVERVFFEQKRDYYSDVLGADLSVCVDASSGEADWSALASCNAIHLSGGNTFEFAGWLGTSGRLGDLRRLAESGSVLIGESAGAILCTPSIEIASLCGDERVWPGEATALGLVPFGFWPHYDRGAESQVSGDGARALDGVVFGCPDGGAVVVDGSNVQTYGGVIRLEDGVEVSP